MTVSDLCYLTLTGFGCLWVTMILFHALGYQASIDIYKHTDYGDGDGGDDDFWIDFEIDPTPPEYADFDPEPDYPAEESWDDSFYNPVNRILNNVSQN